MKGTESAKKACAYSAKLLPFMTGSAREFFLTSVNGLWTLAKLLAGTNVLDVAAGRGALLFPAAAKVGANGYVTGIDFSPDMVRETAKDIESRKLNHAEIRQMDAEQMNFAGCVL